VRIQGHQRLLHVVVLVHLEFHSSFHQLGRVHLGRRVGAEVVVRVPAIWCFDDDCWGVVSFEVGAGGDGRAFAELFAFDELDVDKVDRGLSRRRASPNRQHRMFQVHITRSYCVDLYFLDS